MPEKKTQLGTFLTKVDEEAFSVALRQRIPPIVFIDGILWDDPNPPVRERIDECTSTVVSLLQTDIVAVRTYTEQLVRKHPSGTGYMGATVGDGIIQFMRSQPSRETPGCFKDGRVAANYDPSRVTMKAFVKDVWDILKRHGKKVFPVDRASGVVADKPDAHFVSWPDAAARYDGRDRQYLMHSVFHYFVAK
jgi:hypothetical protein